MKISKIELCNFGSYEGVNVFELGIKNDTTDRKVILIGGKNGAGKTTLFSGIKLCLYGHKAQGFNNVNSFYRKEVKKFFNDLGKYKKDFVCYVKIDCILSNGQADDFYEIKREWNPNANLLTEFEEVSIRRNGVHLDDDEILDFDNYLMNLIPPELFNLFFFDGEQIADYFLDEGGNKRLKDAFMVLCGFDSLDIMEKNFRRITYGKKNSSNDESEYLLIRDKAKELSNYLTEEKETENQIREEIDAIDTEISSLEKKYKQSGGVSYEEWNSKLMQLKEEEKFREEQKIYLKRMANDSIPYIIVKNQLLKLQKQIDNEREKQQFEILGSSLRQLLPDIMRRAYDRLEWREDDELTELVLEEFDNEINQKNIDRVEYVLNLSNKEANGILTAINTYLNFDKQLIIDAENAIEDSLMKTQRIRETLDKFSIEGINEFMETKNDLVEKKTKLVNKLHIQIEKVSLLTHKLLEVESIFRREEKKFEARIKSESVVNLSEKAIIFLDKLQEKLYQNEIAKVESLFINKIATLARKNNFVDKLYIDNDFEIHAYKQMTFSTTTICEKLDEIGIDKYVEVYGAEHCSALLNATKTENLKDFYNKFYNQNVEFNILQEIDKARLSKGEKQIFIMALYWAFMSLKRFEVPFIIDTPFARIDSEHRSNITSNFFMDLQGQVFIFSTNEEIVDAHYETMKGDIQTTFLLENSDNMSTTVISNHYFGGVNNAIQIKNI